MRVMVVAGGQWQVPLIQYLKRAGHFVVNTNLYENSPGFEFADAGLVANVLDRDKNLEIAQQYQIDAVLTDQSDIAVPTCAYIAQQLGLPGIGVEMADLFTQKHLMRKFCVEHGFSSPNFYVAHSTNEALKASCNFSYPLVIKPVDSQSSRGVSKVEDASFLEAAIELALANSRSGTIILEEFIDGVELTVDGVKFSDRHSSLAISCKEHYAHNPMVAQSLLFSQEHDEIDYAALRSLHDRLIEASGLPFGLTHAEYKYYNGKFFLIEVAARGGGTKISSDIVPIMSQIDNYKYFVELATGKTCMMSEEANYGKEKVAILDFLNFPEGTVKRIEGCEQAREIEGVLDLDLAIGVGDRLTPPQEDRSRHGYIIAHAKNRPDLDFLLSKAKAMISIEYES